MENFNNVTEISVKAVLLGEFNDFGSWIKKNQECFHKLGVNSKLLHLDKNGFATNGYDLKNNQNNSQYPVKTYLLVQDPTILEPEPFKSTSNN
jgi:hypothetical protein